MQRIGYDSCLFSEEERAFARMLDEGGILVGDRWFPAGSSELERAKYLVAYHQRLERNRRRRERRHAAQGACRPRNVRGHVPIDDESQRRHRYFLERSKCLRRATVARCPTANEVRTAWAHRLGSPKSLLRLGGLLLDLECFVDNSLIRRLRNGHPLIIGRARGLLGWIRENCPELVCRYKTMMRIKAMAKNIRQNLDIPDPVPTALVLDGTTDPEALADLPLHAQPRPCEDDDPPLVRCRFVWEVSDIDIDAKGRCFRYDENYGLVRNDASYLRSSSRRIIALREKLSNILLNGKDQRTIEKYGVAPDGVSSRKVEMVKSEWLGGGMWRYGAGTMWEDEGGGDLGEGSRSDVKTVTRRKHPRGFRENLERTIEFLIEAAKIDESPRRKRRPREVISDALYAWLSIPTRLMYFPRCTKWDLRNEW